MATIRRKQSMLRMMVEMVEDMVALLVLELKRASLEIKGNIASVELGAVLLVLGATLLLFAGLALIAAAIAALALVLQTWVAALVVAGGLAFFGIAFLFTGLGHFKHFTLVPIETIHRVEQVFREYKKVSAAHRGSVEGQHDPERNPRSPGSGHVAQ